ncbi:MAG: hypothetical protein RMK29_12835 [Myxococcales bacterium]|nr:hypothetical protein [Myxococcota bacterium]MDW8282590.1 hypothetical protein [Myxococcales bacterium]
MRRSVWSVVPLCCALACQPEADPLDAFLQELPPEGGPALARAGRLTEDNYVRERIPGPAEQGLPGDYFMANDRIRVIIQQPGRAIGPVPYGGNIIDMDFVDRPQGDQLGEVGLFLLTGRTPSFRTAEIVRDGSAGGPAVLRFRGVDVLDDYITVQALGPVASIIADELRAETELGLRIAVT